MRVIQRIPIQNIDYPRARLPLTLKTLRFAIALFRDDSCFPPIPVERLANGRFKLKGGRHRLTAHKLAGKTHISAHVAVPEEPYPYKPLVCSVQKTLRGDKRKVEGLTAIPKE